MKLNVLRCCVLLALTWVSPVLAQKTYSDPFLGDIEITPMVTGLDSPWGIEFVTTKTLLITEKSGAIWLADVDGTKRKLRGLPRFDVVGQGGLLDVFVAPNDRNLIFVTYAKQQGSGYGTAVGRFRLDAGRARAKDFTTIFEIAPGSGGGRHFGARIAAASGSEIYVSIGDRGDPNTAQDTSNHNGSILRMTYDGAPSSKNPEPNNHIYSYGHRNPQGLAWDRDGQLWSVEHGARGGDELNRIRPGRNYGWPVIAYGRNYNGSKIGEGTAKPGLEQPAFFWDPSIAPSALVHGAWSQPAGALDGEWPMLQDVWLVSSLKFDMISVLSDTRNLREVARISHPETQRVRDVIIGPRGNIWFLSEPLGTVFQISRDN